MKRCAIFLAALWVAAAGFSAAQEQQRISDVEPLDASRSVASPVLEKSIHAPVPEEYIWTARESGFRCRMGTLRLYG